MLKAVFENIEDQSFITKLVLKETGLITQSNDSQWVLTSDGQNVEQLDLNLRASLAYAEGIRSNHLSQLLPLVALLQVGDLRYNQRERMWNLPFVFSDYLYQLQVITHYFWGWHSMDLNERKRWVGRCNVNPRKLEEFSNILEILEKASGKTADFNPYRVQEVTHEHNQFLTNFKLALFRAQMFETYPYLKEKRGKFLIPCLRLGENSYQQTEVCHTSTTNVGYKQNVVMASGSIRLIAPKEKQAFVVLDLITLYTDYDIRILEERFGRDVISRISDISNREHELYYFLNPFKRARAAYERTVSVNENDVPEGYSSHNRATNTLCKRPRGREVGTFGKVLGEALMLEEAKPA